MQNAIQLPKQGGLGDVAGALPKYLNKIGTEAGVIIPKYGTRWINAQEFSPVFKGAVRIHQEYIPFLIEQEKHNTPWIPTFRSQYPRKI